MPPSLVTCATDEAQVAAHFRAGQEALKQGELTQATEEFKRVLALDPDLVEARVNLGLVYHTLGEYNLAASNLSVALRQRPNMAGPTIILGIDYLKLGEAEKAIPVLQRALRLEPSNQEAHRALATCYRSKEDFRRAADEYRQLASLNPDKADALFKLGHDYLDLSARLAYRGAQLYRDSAWGHRFLGDLLFQRSRWEDAAQEYRQALGIESKQPGLHTSLGVAYLRAGKMEKAEEEFHFELQLDSENEQAWLGLAETQLARGQAAAALDAVGKVWEISPEFLALQPGFPTVEFAPGPARALLTGLQTAPGGPAKHFLLSALHGALGESDQARERRAVFQADFDAWRNAQDRATEKRIAQRPCGAHRYAACADWLQSRNQISVSQRLLLGKTLLTLRQYGRAADTLAQLPAAAEENVEASYWLARSYHALGAECFDRLEESFPRSWRAHQLRGEGYALRQDANDAVKEFRLALQSRPDEPDLYEALGELYLTKKSYEEAQTELEKALALDSSRTHALCLLGRLYVQKREAEKAVPFLQKALRLQPDLVEASGLLGTAYVRLGQYADAVPELKKAAPLDFYGDVHYQLYLAYLKLGKVELADKALARSEELRRTSAARHQAMVMGAAKVEREPD